MLDDLTATFQRDVDGNILRDADGDPIPVTTDPVEAARLRYKEREARGKKSYDGYYPSFNASCNISDTLIARVVST
ncbi:MAG: hypothetical protein ACREIA_17670 [Opitutaceae bacterium]